MNPLLNLICILPLGIWANVYDSDLPIPPTGAAMMVASSADGFGLLDPVDKSVTNVELDLPMRHAFRTGVHVGLSNHIVLAPLNANSIKFLNASSLHTVKDIFLRAAGGYRGAVALLNGTVILTPSMGVAPSGLHSDAFVAVDPDATQESDLRTFRIEGSPSTVYNNAVLDPEGNVLLIPWEVAGGTRPLMGRFNVNTGNFRTIAIGTAVPGDAQHPTPWFQDGVLLPNGKVVLTPVSVPFIGIFDSKTESFEQVDITGPLTTAGVESWSWIFSGGQFSNATGKVVMAPSAGGLIGIFDPSTHDFAVLYGPRVGAKPCNFVSSVTVPSSAEIIFVPWTCPAAFTFDPMTNSSSSDGLSVARVFDHSGWGDDDGYFAGSFWVPGVAPPDPPPPSPVPSSFPVGAVGAVAAGVVLICFVLALCARLRRKDPASGQMVTLDLVRKQVNEAVVKKMFHATVPRGEYEISRVVVLNNSRLSRLSSDYLENSTIRREGSRFQLCCPEGLDAADAGAKRELLNFVEQKFLHAPWSSVRAGKEDADRQCDRPLRVMPVWHGGAECNVNSISETGFACLVHDDAADPGWHANGRYNTSEAYLAVHYAATYPFPKAPNDHGEYVVLLSAAVVGEVYCITPGRHDYPQGPLPPTDPEQCKYYGRGFHAPADTHIVGIDARNMLGTDPKTAAYHEVVSAQDAQLLPLAKVFFKSGPQASASPADDPQAVGAPRRRTGMSRLYQGREDEEGKLDTSLDQSPTSRPLIDQGAVTRFSTRELFASAS